MSLFKTREWWRVQCGDGTEGFDGSSLLVSRRLLGDEGPAECLVVGSHAGCLRIYAPTNKWEEESNAPGAPKSTDLVVESRLASSILDLKAGQFVSGSKDERLAILTPTKLTVYTVTYIKGSVNHGDQCSLDVAYEHELKRFPATLTVGPFGGVQARDFLCVQCLDGTLLFYEQEVFVCARTLKNRLLPEPLIYVPRSDVFVTLGSDWIIQCYKYQNLAESSKKEELNAGDDKKHIVPDWSYNIGEPIIDINAVVLSSFEAGIVVLGERTLYCLGDSCTSIKFAKRLEYSALCFIAYIIEPDGKLMVIVIADTNTLMIYEGTTLKWSAQLPFAPVAVARANLQNLEGAIVILSEEGCLEVCYLGTEPSLFVAPPTHQRGFDYEAAQKELHEIKKKMKESRSSDAQVNNAMIEAELSINPIVSPELLPAPAAEGQRKDDDKDKDSKQSLMCTIDVELTTYALLQDLELVIQVSKPLVVSQDFLYLPNLCEKYTLKIHIHLEGELPPVSPEVCFTASYAKDDGELRVIQKSTEVPLRMLLRPCQTESTAPVAVTIKSAESILSFSQLFPEFAGEYSSRQITNSLGLRHAHTGHVVSLASGLMLNRYRVQATEATALALVVQQLIDRLREKAPAVARKLSYSLAQPHLQLIMDNIDTHFEARLKIRDALKEIGLLTTQLRNIEKRMLRCMKERNSRSLHATGLPTLLDSTYRAIFALLDDLNAARAERAAAFHKLQSSLRLMLLLLRLNANEDKCAFLEPAIEFETQLRDEIDWEEIMDMSLMCLLRSMSRKSATEGTADTRTNINFNRFESTRDLAKLKKHLTHVFEKLSNKTNASIKESPAEELSSEKVGADPVDV